MPFELNLAEPLCKDATIVFNRTMGRATGLLAVALTALAVISAATARPAKDGGTFRIAVTVGLFQSIDPAIYGLESRLLRPACAALMSYPDKPLPAGLRLAPELAESYPAVSADRKTYTFTIRRDARFSTGAPVTARDLVHSLERILDPKTRSFNAGAFEDIVGARELEAGQATTLAGAVAVGRTLRLRLVAPAADLLTRLSSLCAVPSTLPPDPEGAKAPLPSPAPYYVSEYVPGDRVLLERNRFYHGPRPHHVDRIAADLQADVSAVGDVAAGKLDSVAATPNLAPQLAGLVRRYGVNKSRLFIQTDVITQMFLINTSRPPFRNDVQLRKALNFVVDRRALVRVFGPYAAVPTDQYLPPALPGFRDVHIYPLDGPDLAKARALAGGRTRSGSVVLYTCSDRPDCGAAAQVLKQNLKAIGLTLRIRQFPFPILLQKLGRPSEPFDLAWVGYSSGGDPRDIMGIFDGRSIGRPDNQNFSYFDDPKYNRLLARAAGLTGSGRYTAYGAIDVQLARDAAPAIAVLNRTTWAFVSARVGCVVMNPVLDLTAVCLK